jgi:hypothetical protein
VRRCGAVFYRVSYRDRRSAAAPAVKEIADALMPGREYIMGCHMMSKGRGCAIVARHTPVGMSAPAVSRKARWNV